MGISENCNIVTILYIEHIKFLYDFIAVSAQKSQNNTQIIYTV